MPEHKLIDSKDALALLGIGRGSLHYLIDQGDLPVYVYQPDNPTTRERIRNKRLFFLQSDVEALAARDDWRRRPKAKAGDE